MWAASTYYAYAYFASNAERSMGKIGIGVGAQPADNTLEGGSSCTGVSKSQNGFWTAYFYAVPNPGYKFLGWTTSSTSTAYLDSGAALYDKSASTDSSCQLYAHFAVDDTPSGGGGGGGEAPTAGDLVEKTITRTSADVRDCIGSVTLPSDVVEMGFDYMWCSHNYGESSATSYDGNNRKQWSQISAMTFDAGWRMPIYDAETGFNRFTNTTYNSSERRAYSTKEGFTDKYIQFTSSYNYCWLGVTANATSYSSHYYFDTSKGTSTSEAFSGSNNLEFRLVYEPNKVGIYKLTVLVKNVDGTTTTTKACVYYCAKGQQIKITPTAADGYTMKWDSESTTAAAKTFTVDANKSATITYTKQATPSTVTFAVSPAGYGSVTQQTITNVPNGASISVNGSEITINGTTVGANATEATVQYEYAFTGWSNTSGTITADRTITANFERTTNKYPVTFYDEDSKTVLQETEFEYGSHPTYNGTTPSKAATTTSTFTFAGWTDGAETYGVGTQLPTVVPDQEYTAVFNEEALPEYTITINTPENGTITVKNGNTVINNGDKVLVNPVLTLPAKAATDYKFSAWTNDAAESVTVTKDMTFGATFAALQKYDLTINECDGGKIVVTGGGKTYDAEGTYADALVEGVTYTCKLVPDNTTNGWGWWLDEQANIIGSVQSYKFVAGIDITADQNLYAGFGLKRVQLQGSNRADGYDQYIGTLVHEVEYVRTFKAGTWSTMWLPFNIELDKQGLVGILYELNDAVVEEKESYVNVELNVKKTTGLISTGEPCLFYSKTAVTNMVLHDVMFMPYEGPTLKSQKKTKGVVDFIGTDYPQVVGGVTGGSQISVDENRSYRYLSSNVLYFPNAATGIYFETFRAYFQINNYSEWYNEDGSVKNKAPRMVIVSEEGEIMEADDNTTAVDVLKYIENGQLIIERNGVKYNVAGARAE